MDRTSEPARPRPLLCERTGAWLVLGLAVAAVLLPSCGSTAQPAPAAPLGGVVLKSFPKDIPLDLSPSFRALAAAVEDGHDELARRILSTLRARRLTGAQGRAVRELSDAFERILDGRQLVESVRFTLRSEITDLDAGRFRLFLDASHEHPEALTLHFPPAILERLASAIGAGGTQTRHYENRLIDRFDGLELPAGKTVSVPLFGYDVSLGNALALRDEWRLRLHGAGEIVRAGVSYPAKGMPCPASERTVIASFLPTVTVTPATLAEYAGRDALSMPPLIERTVRIPVGRSEETLALLLPIVEALERDDPERLEQLSSSLRWLARVDDPGPSWSRYLRARQQAHAERDAPPRPDLELPIR